MVKMETPSKSIEIPKKATTVTMSKIKPNEEKNNNQIGARTSKPELNHSIFGIYQLSGFDEKPNETGTHTHMHQTN